MNTLKERRRASRISTRVPLEIYDPKGRAIVAEGRLIDMSILGARVQSKKPMKPRTAIYLHVVPADKPALELAGQIIWTRKKAPGFEYGIRFKPGETARSA